MSAHIYIEGSRIGSNSKQDQILCRRGFRALLEKAGFSGRMPGLTACGPRGDAFADFKVAHSVRRTGDYVAMLLDSEDPVTDIEKTWDHLHQRDGWTKPNAAEDKQVLFMTTCMETWIVTDRAALREHYGSRLQENALPALQDMEGRNRHTVQNALISATRNCSNAYAKGRRSFEILEKLNPATLQALPSFARIKRILDEEL